MSFASPEDVRTRLAKAGYLASDAVATTVYLAATLGKPLLVRHGRGTPCSKPPCFGGVFKHDVEAAIACDSASHQHIVWWGNGEESGGSCVVRGAVAGHVQQ